MKVAVPGASRLNHALKALPGVRSESAGSTTKVRIAAAAESFRLLALNLRILLPADSTPAVVVMSAFPHEGRSFVAENLAVAMAEQDPVMLVEQIGEEMVLRDRLAARQNGASSAVPSSLRDSVLTTDHPGVFLHTTPTAATGSLSLTLKEMADAGFFTIVDSPPALTSSRAFLLAREVGQVIYVVTQKVQDVDVHRQIREQLDRLGVEILGLVVNEG